MPVQLQFRHITVKRSVLALGMIIGFTLIALSQDRSSDSQWDAEESKLVDLISKANPALANWPATQIVSPPVEISLSSAARTQDVFAALADQIPEWGPYFKSSGRSLRAEYKKFVENIDAPANTFLRDAVQQLTTPPELSTAFQFNPSPTAVAKTFTGTTSPASVSWDADSHETNVAKSGAQRRLRIRLGRSRLSIAQSAELQELYENDFTATFVADALDLVYVKPGHWFSASLLRQYKDGPFKTQPSSPLLGSNGILGLRIRALVIARNPSFQIQLDKRNYIQIKEFVSGGGNIVIGPFIAGTLGGRLTFDDVNHKITSSGTDGTYVIAILNEVN